MDIRRDETQARELSQGKRVLSIWEMLSLGILGGGSPGAPRIKFSEEDLDRGERSRIISRGGSERRNFRSGKMIQEECEE